MLGHDKLGGDGLLIGFQPTPRAITRAVVSGPIFPTTWPLTENPISLGGVFTLGGTNGLDWQNVRSNGGSPGIAYGVGASAGFDDCLATVQGQGFSTTKHYSEIRIVKVGGYTPPSTHEVETLTGFTITANSAKGYEMDFGFNTSVQPVRWNGALGDFDTTVFTLLSGTPFVAADGDIIRTVFDSTSGSPVLTVFLGGVQQVQYTDTTAGKILTGFPGIGFFAAAGTGLDMTKYCNNRFDCGNA